MKKTNLLNILISNLLIFLASCGGNNTDTPTTPPEIEAPITETWQSGVFLPAETYRAKCLNPRNGTNPATESSYPDIAGEILDENNFLRSWSDNTYLWYDEITDLDPANFDNPLDYFDELKSFETTASGSPKDKFHYTYDSLEWYNLSQGGVSAGYGVEWALISATPPREIVVAYTEPDSPATDNNIERGAIILEVDGFDINTTSQDGINALNAGTWPSSIGETHEFTLQDLNGTVRTIALTSKEINNAMVQNTRVVSTATGNVGYMTFNFFRAPAEAALVAAINDLNSGAGIDDLVLDLRYNSGGYLAIASQLTYMIAGANATAGKTFETLQFNDKHPSTDPVTGAALTPTPFYDETIGLSLGSGQPLPTLDLTRVYVLTSGDTCSASEAVINGLRGIGVQVIQIGSTTCGKPYGFYPTDNCGTTYFTVQFRGVNYIGFGDYSDGFVPSETDDGMSYILGCQVNDDFYSQLGDINEDLLSAALSHQSGEGCPNLNTSNLSFKKNFNQKLLNGSSRLKRSLFDSNRILKK